MAAYVAIRQTLDSRLRGNEQWRGLNPAYSAATAASAMNCDSHFLRCLTVFR
jgi:hypothetical protein